MDVPGIVQSELGGEDVAASVSLGGEDSLYVTPTRTIVYHSESLLSDESIDEYPHDAERVTLNEGRRKTRITLTYSIDGERDFTVPSSVADDVLHPVLAGVLNGTGVTAPGETVVQTFRFSELTLIVTSERLVKHVGSAVWDADHEEYHFEDVTRLDFEEGSVATQIVIEVDGRPQRIKTPNDHVAEVRQRLTQALFAYYDVDSLAAFNELAPSDEDPAESSGGAVDFGEGVDPLGESGSGDRPADTSGDSFLDEADDGEPLMGGGDDADRRPGQGDASGSEERRRAEPADDSAARRRAEPADEQGDDRRAQPASNATGGTDAGTAGAGADASASGAGADASTTGSGAGTPGADATATDVTESNGASGQTTGGGQAAGDDRAQAADADGADATPDADTGDSGAETAEQGEFEAAGFEPATASSVDAAELEERLESLEERVEAQNQLLERQQALIQQLIEELRERN